MTAKKISETVYVVIIAVTMLVFILTLVAGIDTINGNSGILVDNYNVLSIATLILGVILVIYSAVVKLVNKE